VVGSAYAPRNLSAINTVSLDATPTTQLTKYPISADVIYLTSCFGNSRVSLLRCKAVCASHYELLSITYCSRHLWTTTRTQITALMSVFRQHVMWSF